MKNLLMTQSKPSTKALSLLIAMTVFVCQADENFEKNTSVNNIKVNSSSDRVELKTSFIKGNKELPQALYIVPWQEIKKTKATEENIVLHSLYGDIFQPVTPTGLN